MKQPLMSTLFAAMIVLAGCATTITPEQRQLAEQRKGQTLHLQVTLEASDNYATWCGHVKPNESVSCSQGILQRKLTKKAEAHCVFYTMGKIQWQGTSGGLFNRSTVADADVTCTGSKE